MIETERLKIRELSYGDCSFILTLLNDPSFLQYIGDKKIRTLEDAWSYIQKGPMTSYQTHGFGLYVTCLKETGIPIGICGLIKRETLPDVDLGFAFLPEHCSKGYAIEASQGVLERGYKVHQLKRVVAIVSPDNQTSCRLLEKLGFEHERMIKMTAEDPEIKLYAIQA